MNAVNNYLIFFGVANPNHFALPFRQFGRAYAAFA